MQTETASELAVKALSDTTKYDALEVGHALTDNVMDEIRECIAKHNQIFAEDEYCIVRIIGEDAMHKNVRRQKYYGWLYLPSPRPNQAVFLYNKVKDTIKRLWVLPSAMVMSELASLAHVDKRYQTMQAWSIAFFKGTFWEYIRYEHGIDMLSEKEYLEAHREELIKAGCKVPTSNIIEPFDFSDFEIKKFKDSLQPTLDQ